MRGSGSAGPSRGRPGRCWRRRGAGPIPASETPSEPACPGAEAIRSTCAPPAREQWPVKRPVALHERRRRGRPLEPEHRDPRGDQRPRGERLASARPTSTGPSGCCRGRPGSCRRSRARGLRAARGSRRRGSRRGRRSTASGGVSLNVLNASTHESCVARLHVGTWRNTPPRSEPLRTVTLPPRSTADTSRRRSAAVVVDAPADEPLQVVAPLRVADEDEAAMRADAAQERVERLLHVAVGREVVASASSSRPAAPGPSPAGRRARTRGRPARSARPGRARSSGSPGRRAWSPADVCWLETVG